MSDELSFNVQSINGDGSVRFGGQQIVIFYNREVLDEYKSREAGTPQYFQRDFVKVIHPGEKDILDRPADDLDKSRWAAQWNAYVAKKEQIIEGTPLIYLFPGNPETVANLKAIHISTIQQLANLTDSAVSNLQFGADLRQKAKTFLEGAEKGKTFHALEQRVQEQDSVIKRLQEQIEQLKSDKPKAGRPKKAVGEN